MELAGNAVTQQGACPLGEQKLPVRWLALRTWLLSAALSAQVPKFPHADPSVRSPERFKRQAAIMLVPAGKRRLMNGMNPVSELITLEGSLVSWELRSNLSAGTWATGDGSLRAELLSELSFPAMAPQMEPFSQAIAASRPSSAHVLGCTYCASRTSNTLSSTAYESEEAPGLFDVVRISEDPVNSPWRRPGRRCCQSAWSPSVESWRLISVCSSVPEYDHREALTWAPSPMHSTCTVRVPFQCRPCYPGESRAGSGHRGLRSLCPAA